MNFRYKFSIILVILGLISVIMSFGGNKSAKNTPEKILGILESGMYYVSPDVLANMIVEEDSSMQIIDVRTPEMYQTKSLPGAVNIPLNTILQEKNRVWFEDKNIKSVLYSNDEISALQAWMLLMQKDFSNLFILEGGFTGWDSIVMHSEFKGEKITARENALFEKRYQARRLFTQWNAMPDSLKAGFFAEKKKKDKELVGGCE
jgi:rhodanese-related sulfurtransferase